MLGEGGDEWCKRRRDRYLDVSPNPDRAHFLGVETNLLLDSSANK